MKPGRKIDALVHENVFGLCVHDDTVFREDTGYVFGCRKCGDRGHGFTRPASTSLPSYSTDMGAAWRVVEILRLGGSLISVGSQPDGWWVVNRSKVLNPRGDGTADGWDDTYPDTTVRVMNPAHGICLVAVDFWLGEEVMAEYLADCPFCSHSRTVGHAPDCPFLGMRPDIQEMFAKSPAGLGK